MSQKRLIYTALAILTLAMVHVPVFESQTSPGVEIGDVTVKIENRTNTYHLLFRAEGTAPPATDHVNVTFGFENSTTRETLDMWIEPTDQDLIMASLELSPRGPGEDPWTSWILEASADIPVMDDLTTTVEMVTALLGVGSMDLIEGSEELENITGIQDLVDMEDAMEVLMETRILFIARAVDEEGNFTEDEKDIKLELLDAVYRFIEDEGYVEEPSSDPEDGESVDQSKEEEGEGSGSQIWIMLISAGAGLLVIAIAGAIAVLLVAGRNRR